MTVFKIFLQNYGTDIIYTILMAIATFIGGMIKAKYTSRQNDKIKRETVEYCVKAGEQLYRDLGGPEKFARVSKNIIEILNQKGIKISEIEMKMMIESVVSQFNLGRLYPVDAEIEISEETNNYTEEEAEG